MRRPCASLSGAVAFLFLTLPLVVAHGEDAAHSMAMSGANSGAFEVPDYIPPTYYNHEEYAGWLCAHIILMTLGWTVVLPIAVMISVARSRLAIPFQFIFLALNAVGVLASIIYDAKTPDLYENNAHHKIGWAVTWIAVVWVLLGFVRLVNSGKGKAEPSRQMPAQAVASYAQLQDYELGHDYRWSGDSGRGSEGTLCSPSRSQSSESVLQKPERPSHPESSREEIETDHHDSEQRGFLSGSSVDRFLSRKAPKFSKGCMLNATNFLYIVLERLQVLLGFLALTTGIVTWIGIFRPDGFLNGLAHWVKGGIFFWYGIVTLGRWMGAFTDFGWAWNVRPKYPTVSRFASKMPSAEFIESAVIFTYGVTNVFMEHLTAWGHEWSMMDLEHLGITFMFFGGGLLGILIESHRVRDFLNTNILLKQDDCLRYGGAVEAQREAWLSPKTYETSLNPVPGLVILLLGLMMSSHHQDSIVSTLLHSQWGTLFIGFALARASTYILLFLNPPSSHFPSRPPSEVIAAFCLISGGLIFMTSTRDVVKLLERNKLDAMFIFTVMMGVTLLLMAWTTVLYGIKGWASRREARKTIL